MQNVYKKNILSIIFSNHENCAGEIWNSFDKKKLKTEGTPKNEIILWGDTVATVHCYILPVRVINCRNSSKGNSY